MNVIKTILKPTPVLIDFYNFKPLIIAQLDNGLKLAYPPKTYAEPWRVNFILKDGVYEEEAITEINRRRDYTEKRVYRGHNVYEVYLGGAPRGEKEAIEARIVKIPKQIAIVKIEKRRSADPHVKTITTMTILPPTKRETRPRYRILVAIFSGKSTNAGAYMDAEPLSGNVLYQERVCSRTCNHWERLFIIAVKPSERVKFRFPYISNRGHSYGRVAEV